MPVITIGKKEFLKGESLSVYASDGGYSSESGAFENNKLNSNMGLLVPGRSASEFSTNLDSFVAATSDIINNGGGKYYSVLENRKLIETDPLTDTHTVRVIPGAGKTYDTTHSSVLKYNGKLYISSQDDIWEENLSTFTGNLYTWWTVTLGKTALTVNVPHILFEFNGVMYITNGNKVWKYDGSAGYTTGSGTLTLESSWIIQDVMIYRNYIYLGCTKGTASNQENYESRVFIWDGYSATWQDEINIQTRSLNLIKDVDGLPLVSSALGIYTFNGEKFKIKKPTVGANSRHAVAIINSFIYFGYGSDLYCYAIDYNALYKVASFSTSIAVVRAGVSNTLHVYTRELSTAKYYKLTSNNKTPVQFVSNYYEFEQPTNISRVEIVFNAALASGADYTVTLHDELDTEIFSKQITYSADGALKKWSYQVHKKVDAVRAKVLSNNSANKFVRWIKIYFEASETKTSKK